MNALQAAVQKALSLVKSCKYVESLTPEQAAAMPGWAEKWISIGLSTEPADREAFAVGAEDCYKAAKLVYPGVCVWASGPTIAPMAGPIAHHLLVNGGDVDQVCDMMIDAPEPLPKPVQEEIREIVRKIVNAVDRGHPVKKLQFERPVPDEPILREGVRKTIREKRWSWIGGQFWVGGWWGGPAFISFFQDICGLTRSKAIDSAARAYQLTASSAGYWWPHTHFVIASERPSVLTRDGQGRLHNATGPCVKWDRADNHPESIFEMYRYHGVMVPEWIIKNPELITTKMIGEEENTEVKRVMIEIFGFERYLREASARLIDEATEGHPIAGLRGAKLWQLAEGVIAIEMKNSTTEPDGTRKTYIIPVDGTMYQGKAGSNCHAAIASTWRTKEDNQKLAFDRYQDYCPGQES